MGETLTKRRNGLVDFLKFFFAETVASHHAVYLPGFSEAGREHFLPFGAGYMAVEFFFICSGFYLARQAFSHGPVRDSREIGRQTFFQIKKRIHSLYPVFWGGSSYRLPSTRSFAGTVSSWS